jgi:hypothetical protein
MVAAQEAAKEHTSRVQKDTVGTMGKKRKQCGATSMNGNEDTVKDYEAQAAEVRQAAKPSRVMVYDYFPLLGPH